MGIFWAIIPLFGWSEYSLEGALISCSVEWNKRTTSVISYNISITVLVYLIPLLVIIITNAKIIYTVRFIQCIIKLKLKFVFNLIFRQE